MGNYQGNNGGANSTLNMSGPQQISNLGGLG